VIRPLACSLHHSGASARSAGKGGKSPGNGLFGNTRNPPRAYIYESNLGRVSARLLELISKGSALVVEHRLPATRKRCASMVGQKCSLSWLHE
jgi:hypothetical protein